MTLFTRTHAGCSPERSPNVRCRVFATPFPSLPIPTTKNPLAPFREHADHHARDPVDMWKTRKAATMTESARWLAKTLRVIGEAQLARAMSCELLEAGQVEDARRYRIAESVLLGEYRKMIEAYWRIPRPVMGG